MTSSATPDDSSKSINSFERVETERHSIILLGTREERLETAGIAPFYNGPDFIDPNEFVWPKRVPILPLDWFDGQLDIFIRAVRAATSGELEVARDILATIRSDEMRAWYAIAACSGTVRFNALGRRPTAISSAQRDKIQDVPAAMKRAVFERDGYRCRYCANRIVPLCVLERFEDIVGNDVFLATGTDQTRHGITLLFRAVADHVVPWNLGGATSLDNLVTACWPCNFAKSSYTLDQLGLDDPRNRPPVADEWRGLTDALPK
jgi:5-methylcytosine-specific restriction endonuclease McrA